LPFEHPCVHGLHHGWQIPSFSQPPVFHNRADCNTGPSPLAGQLLARCRVRRAQLALVFGREKVSIFLTPRGGVAIYAAKTYACFFEKGMIVERG
jgi:hypothetical protein